MQPEPVGDRTNRHRVVTGDHLDRNILNSKIIQRFTGVGPHLLLQHNQRYRGDLTRRLGMVDGHTASSQQQHPQSLRSDPLGLSGRHRSRIEQHVGRADHPVTVIAKGDAAPLGGRLERRVRGHDPARRRVKGLGDCLHARVGTGVGGGQGGQHIGDTFLSTSPVELFDLADPHATFGQCAGLVGADHVHPRQPLDGGQLLHQALTLAEPDHPDGEGDRGHQHQAFGNHRHQRAHHPQHGFPPSHVCGEQLGVDGQQAGRHQQVSDELQNPVDAVAQFGFHQGELAGLGGQFGCICFAADLGGAVGAGTGDDETARHHGIASVFGNRVGLAGQQ
ncbi:Uncharacterised protein [Mycobacterium tuberculosis]|uniref:Uncharacterized protein n=1 Tax=Mycobacterium tuberculosis TaxID=1773 RepID=A0A655AH17_MYCTX|nr:Uncharacterised protein [Mycobacterium tuberculosis]